MKNLRFNRLSKGVIAVAFSLLSVAFAPTGMAQAAQKVRVDIPAQDLSAALTQFGRETGTEIVFAPDAVREKKAVAVKGEFERNQALRLILEGSGLTYRVTNQGAIVVESAKTSADIAQVADLHLAQSEAQSQEMQKVENTEKSAKNSSSGSESVSSETDEATSKGIPEILVKGSRGGSLNADIQRTPDDVRPYVVIDREAIGRSTASNAGELLRERLTMSYVRNSTNQTANAGTAVGNFSSFALRGLADAETLILIDGRRATMRRSQATEFQSDLNSIPLSSIERIEILPTGSAGIYGGNAGGGVINVILRRDYSGLETNLHYEDTLAGGGAVRSIDVYGGTAFRGGRVSVAVSGSYSDADRLLIQDRDFVGERRSESFDSILARSPTVFFTSASPVLGATTNISSARVGATVPNLVLKNGQSLNSPITFIPIEYPGAQSDGGAALLANAGRYNLDFADSNQSGGGSRQSLLGDPIVASLASTVRFRIAEQSDAYFELGVSRNDQSFYSSALQARFTIPQSSPINPFQQSIAVNAPLEGLSNTVTTKSDDRRVLLGSNVRFARGWTAAVEGAFSSNVVEQFSPSIQFSNAAAAAVTSGSINVLQDPRTYTPELLQYLLPPNSVTPTSARLTTVTARVAGEAFELPAGNVTVSMLAERRHQNYGRFSTTRWDPNGSQLTVAEFSDGTADVSSAYLEVRVPLASEAKSLLGIRSAEMQIAGHYDQYRLKASYQVTSQTLGLPSAINRFSSVDPSVGFKIQPVRDLALRASYGTGFLPPYLAQLQRLPSTTNSPATLRDPKRSNEALGSVTSLVGGNPDLEPERSRNWSAGLIVTPWAIPNFRLSFDWTKIRKRDNITSVGLTQPTLDNEDLLPGLIVRSDPAPGDPFAVGRIVGFDARYFNATRALSESYDFALDYTLADSKLGSWMFSGAATRLVHNLRQTTPLISPLEQAGTGSSPTWAAHAEIGWAWREWQLQWSARFLGTFWVNSSHTVDVNQGSDHIPSETYHDLSGAYNFGTRAGGRWLSGVTVRGGVRNVFNTEPRFYALGVNSYDGWSDPRMATYFVSVRKSFN